MKIGTLVIVGLGTLCRIDSTPDATGFCHVADLQGNRCRQNGKMSLFHVSTLKPYSNQKAS